MMFSSDVKSDIKPLPAMYVRANSTTIDVYANSCIDLYDFFTLSILPAP